MVKMEYDVLSAISPLFIFLPKNLSFYVFNFLVLPFSNLNFKRHVILNANRESSPNFGME